MIYLIALAQLLPALIVAIGAWRLDKRLKRLEAIQAHP